MADDSETTKPNAVQFQMSFPIGRHVAVNWTGRPGIRPMTVPETSTTRRVPAGIAAQIAEVKPSTLRQWAARGHITRHHDGYDIAEIIARVDTRDRARIPARFRN